MNWLTFFQTVLDAFDYHGSRIDRMEKIIMATKQEVLDALAALKTDVEAIKSGGDADAIAKAVADQKEADDTAHAADFDEVKAAVADIDATVKPPAV